MRGTKSERATEEAAVTPRAVRKTAMRRWKSDISSGVGEVGGKTGARADVLGPALKKRSGGG